MALPSTRLALVTLGLAAALGTACTSTTTDPSPGGGQGGASAGIPEARSKKAFDTMPAPPAADVAALVAGTNDLGFALERALGESKNLIFSPVSIATALSMTYAGARGSTEKQMAEVLGDTLGQAEWHAAFNRLVVDLATRNVPIHPTEQGDKSLKLHLADAAFAQKGYALEPAYLDTLAVHYDAGVKLLDFAGDPEGSRALINAWVEDDTEHKIKDLLGPGTITGATRLVLANALYFYGSWRVPFEKASTQDATFHAPGGDVTVPTMRKMLPAPYLEGDGFKATELGYDGDAIAMTIVLPDDGKLAEVEGKLSHAWLAKIAEDLGKSGTDVDLHLPKWKLTWGATELAGALKALGMKDAFSLPPADFSGMEPKRELYISHVLHKAFVGVDEYGTEAAAATAVVMDKGSGPAETKELKLDRPFLFFIRDTLSGAVLFGGKVVDPTK